MIQLNREIRESERGQHLGDRRQLLGFHHRRHRSNRIDIALKELAEATLRWPVRAPDGLNLVALEELRQLALVLRDDAGERYGEVIAKSEVGLAACLMLATTEDLEDQLVAFFTVLSEESLNVLERGRLERLEAITLVHVAHNRGDMLTPSNLVRKEVACAARRFSRCRH